MHTFSTLGAAAALLALATLPAAATVTKTWVSSTGTDSGTCQLVAPCKTFQFAHDQTSPGGEIDVKDTGSYGGLTITKAISIVSGDGALAAVGATQGGTAITVNAGSGNTVTLQGLVIDGHGLGQYGVRFLSGAGLTVENCKIRNFTYAGVSIEGYVTYFNITDTEISGNSGYGIRINTAIKTNGSISRVNGHNNDTGIFVGDSNTSVINSTITGNNYGIYSYSDGNVLLGQSTVSENATDGVVNISIVNSYGDNYINANGTDIVGSISYIQRR